MQDIKKIRVADALYEVYRRLNPNIDPPRDIEIPVIGRKGLLHARKLLAAAVKARKITLWFKPVTLSGGVSIAEEAPLQDIRELFEGMRWTRLRPTSTKLARSLFETEEKYFEETNLLRRYVELLFLAKQHPRKRSKDD